MTLTALIIILTFASMLALEISRVRKGNRNILPTLIAGICGVFLLSLVLVPTAALRDTTTVFKSAGYKGKTGKLSLTFTGKFSLVAKDKKSGKTWKLIASKGVILIPAGSYNLISYEAAANDKRKAAWIAGCGSLNRAITVKADSTQKLKLGPPFVASITISPKGSDVSMDLRFTGSGNEQCTILKSSGVGDEPRFKVINASGAIMWQGSFKYG